MQQAIQRMYSSGIRLSSKVIDFALRKAGDARSLLSIIKTIGPGCLTQVLER